MVNKHLAAMCDSSCGQLMASRTPLGSMNRFGGQNTAKSALKRTFLHTFSSVRLQAISAPSTPFNASWATASHALHTCARVGRGNGGHMWVKKWSIMISPKVVPRPLRVLEEVVWSCLESFLTHMNPCRFPKSFSKGQRYGPN